MIPEEEKGKKRQMILSNPKRKTNKSSCRKTKEKNNFQTNYGLSLFHSINSYYFKNRV